MPKFATITKKDNTLYLKGELDFNNVKALYEQSLAQFNQSPLLIIDCSGLSSSNSAGLALMIEWIKLAKAKQQAVKFLHLSPQLRSIAKAAELDCLMDIVA